jgi:flagellar biogenesis protein FliO
MCLAFTGQDQSFRSIVMPVQPSISPEQIITIVVFILMLIAVMWFIRRHKGGIASKLHASRRMVHVEDLSLAPQQRLHLIEVDGRSFLVHVGKGHAAGFMPVDGNAPEFQTTSVHLQQPAAAAKKSSSKADAPSPKTRASKPQNAFSAAIAQARRNNPNLEFGK